MHPHMQLSNGATFAGFRIIRLLGSGGMGEVYLAEHPRLPRQDALKILGADIPANEEYRQRFIREADLAATLWHPNIVRVNDRGEYNGQLWIAMDYVDGTDAASLLRDRYPAGMPVDEVAAIITAIASALDYAHQHGLLHRDVKPANILLGTPADDERRILLGDFGIARNIGDVSGLTATNMTMGTLPYAAPEQLMDDPMDGRADQYALAATVYHLLTGSPMFPQSNPAAVISRHLNTPPPALADSHSELAGLDPVLARALAKDPANRFTRCTDFARAFAAATQPGTQAAAAAPTMEAPVTSRPRARTGVAPKPPIEASDSRPRWPITVAVIAVILLLFAVAFVVRPWQHDRATSGTTGTPTSVTPSITFDGMRDFVTAYYRDLPENPNDAWTKLDAHCQNQTGFQQFLDFWATIQSVTLVSVSPRDATSVTARLTYVRRDGQSDTEDRWFRMALVNGAMLLDESQRIGLAQSPSGTTTVSTSAQSSGPNQTIADYIKQDGIEETMISHNTPGAPTIDLAVPDGWKVVPESTDAPYGGIVFNTPTDPNDPPKIIAIVEKLTGNVNRDTLLSYASGEIKNLQGYEGGDGQKSTLGGFPAYQLGGDYMKDGTQREVAQKTVVIQATNGLYVLQLNAEGPQADKTPLMNATTVINDKTTITP